MNLVFHLKGRFQKSYTRKRWIDGCRRQAINDGVFINEKENEKEKKSSTAKTTGQRNIFAKGIAWCI